MADMTATGWDASGAIVILKQSRPWGANQERENLVQLNFRATNFGDGAAVYPSAGIPAPAATTAGFREHISYIIPFGPFARSGGGGAGVTIAGQAYAWSAVVPTGGVSGTTPRNAPLIRLFGVANPTALGGADQVFLALKECPTTRAASDIVPTGAIDLTAYALFVGK